MCGICGIADWRGRDIPAERVVSMRDLMVSRGPDDAGLYSGPGIALGHRRLSIIDLSEAGHQPMCNEDGCVWLVFNGEIYNFGLLRDQLIDRGHRFGSRTDTEVLLHGYEQWGIDGLARRIVGMFAVAIWDARSREVHLLRDHVGKKPLFYRFGEGRLVFASDVKCLWQEADGSLSIDPRALDEYLYYYFITQERSIYQGVSKVLPGHRVTIGPDGVSQSRFWAPDYSRKETRSMDEWLEGIDAHLSAAVCRRLVADVPLGAFLSGGVDSSTVCATMARDGGGVPSTFSVGFPDVQSYDESPHALAVSRHIGSEHRELSVAGDAFSLLPRIVWHYGEPFADSSALPTYLISRAASEHVRVVLTGDGGDEAFAGYDRYAVADRERCLRWLPGWFRRSVFPAAGRYPSRLFPTCLFAERIRVFVCYAAGLPEALAGNLCWWDGLRSRLYTSSWRSRIGDWHPVAAQADLLNSLSGHTQVDRALEYVLRVRLPSDYLAKVDVATMAHSLEARCPFLDVDLLTFAATIPAELLLADGTTKALLKRHAERLLPRQVIHRPKQGFALPIGEWMRTTHRRQVEAVLFSDVACSRGVFDPSTVARVWLEHTNGTTDHTHRLWTLLVLEVWFRLFVDRTLTPDDPLVPV